MKDDSKELINDISDLLRQIANDLEDEDTSEEDETLSGYSVIDLVTEVDVSRLTADEGGSVGAYMAEVRIWCNDCRERFGLLPEEEA